jgi:hypothetical protein
MGGPRQATEPSALRSSDQRFRRSNILQLLKLPIPRGNKNPVAVCAVTGLERIQKHHAHYHEYRGISTPLPARIRFRIRCRRHPPKGSFNRRTRKSIDQHEFSYLIIEGDPFDKDQFGFRPCDFDSPTLKWAMNSATLIVVWGGQVPFSPDRFAETLKAYIRPGGRIVIALIRDANHDEWVRFAYEESREGVELFAIKGIPGLPAGAKRQSCPTSGTVH